MKNIKAGNVYITRKGVSYDIGHFAQKMRTAGVGIVVLAVTQDKVTYEYTAPISSNINNQGPFNCRVEAFAKVANSKFRMLGNLYGDMTIKHRKGVLTLALADKMRVVRRLGVVGKANTRYVRKGDTGSVVVRDMKDLAKALMSGQLTAATPIQEAVPAAAPAAKSTGTTPNVTVGECYEITTNQNMTTFLGKGKILEVTRIANARVYYHYRNSSNGLCDKAIDVFLDAVRRGALKLLTSPVQPAQDETLAVGQQYQWKKGNLHATITSMDPFLYRWSDGAAGAWNKTSFLNEVADGTLTLLPPATSAAAPVAAPAAPAAAPAPAPITTSPDILKACLEVQEQRGASRDAPNGERSMKRTVDMFNACFGTNLTETQGWQFMVCLKMARSVHGDFNMDDYIDGTSYFALAGECEAKGK